jgi:hypothetical protein
MAGNNGVGGATVGLFDVSSNLVASATTDGTGFYYFANTAGLMQGATYTVKVTGMPGGYSASNPPRQSFAWAATPVSLGNFTLH